LWTELSVKKLVVSKSAMTASPWPPVVPVGIL